MIPLWQYHFDPFHRRNPDMPHYVQTVHSRSLPGLHAEYSEWYRTTHIPEVLALDGYSSAEFLRSTTSVDDGAAVEFICIYQLETHDLPALQVAMVAAGSSMTPVVAMDLPATRIEFFEKVPT